MSQESQELLVELEPATSADPSTKASPLRTWAAKVPAAASGPGVTIGRLAAWDDAGRPLVDFLGNPDPTLLPARTTVPLSQSALGREVALMWIDGDPRRPLVIGLLESAPRASAAPTAEIDGEQLVFTAEKEIVFRCGEASITLTKAGKVLIKGAYLLSRSSGVNRIKGGSVQIN
jgi:hypothetical protein